MFQIWPRVKAANPHLSSVCELGAIVGSMWRDLDPADKQYYNDQFSRDKVGAATLYCKLHLKLTVPFVYVMLLQVLSSREFY